MVIKIKPKFTKEQIEKLLSGKLKRVQQAYLAELQYIGEEFVKNARQNADFTDRTGNLRNSIGYIILKDGKQISGNFQQTAKGGSDGIKKAREKALEVSEKFPTGYALICVAGMEYAAAVESKGFDVISSSSVTAKNDLIKGVESLYKKFKKL